jgi:tetratricopeptide (TPR) repeat protein
MYAFKDYIERKVVDDAGISALYTSILHSLTNGVGQKGNHDEVIRLCEAGIKRCVEYGAYFSFASLLFNKGYALALLGRKDEARKYLQEAFYLNRARGKLQSCEINKKFADEHGIEL